MRQLLLLSAIAILLINASLAQGRPNVVLVITDDQGYGEIAAHGNDIIKTPHLDKLHSQSVRLTNFHVDPTCSPTRSALMTGRYSTRTGVWHTIMGRSLMRGSELTLAEVMRNDGYRTAMLGKWHLGDNYPMRPQDQGFDHAFYHGGGGVGQTPDYFGNDYFDDTYFRWNAADKTVTPEKKDGYCTDIWFDDAMQFIEANKDKPFFVYLATNAPHGPFNVDEKYAKPYEGKTFNGKQVNSNFYGMITNIDDNMGRLMAKLDELNLSEDTILIFMTDNGSAAPGFNAGMRGNKGSSFDGGHRTPFFIRWPKGGIGGGRDFTHLTAHIDVLPTLADLCGITRDDEDSSSIDGISFRKWLAPSAPKYPDRTLFVHSQRIEYPEKWRNCAVMTQRWRLRNGTELYDMDADPGQQKNIAAEHADVVTKLRGEYDIWWNSLTPSFDKDVRITIGHENENTTRLTGHDWHSDKVPWHQNSVRNGLNANGYWLLNVHKAGTYKVELRRWPTERPGPIEAIAVSVSIGEVTQSTVCQSADEKATLMLNLAAGPAKLQTQLTNDKGQSRCAYYVYITKQE